MHNIFDEISVSTGRAGKRKRCLILLLCPNCKKERWVQKRYSKKQVNPIVCLRCYFANNLGKNSSRWNGGKNLNAQGYIMILAVGHPLARKNGYILEHRLIAAERWGIFAVMGMHVHHKDGNKQNNSTENLELIAPDKHHSLHNRGENSLQKVVGEPNTIVSCACGCGSEFLKYNKWGRTRKYSIGHSGIIEMNKNRRSLSRLNNRG